MKANSAFLFFTTALVSAVLFIPSYTSAATYKWDDYLTPFRREIRLGPSSNVIDVSFPDDVIKSYTQIELIIKHSGLEERAGARNLSHRLQFFVNERAIVGGYDSVEIIYRKKGGLQ